MLTVVEEKKRKKSDLNFIEAYSAMLDEICEVDAAILEAITGCSFNAVACLAFDKICKEVM